MKNQTSIQKKGIPETRDDISKNIFTFLHVEESEIFQLLYNETDKRGINKFQIFGRFRGEKCSDGKNKGNFLLKEIDLKLVNMAQRKEADQYTITKAEFIEKSNKEKSIIVTIYIKEAAKQQKGIDLTTKEPFYLKKNQIIEYHIKNEVLPSPVTRNGIPCNTMTFF